jgi:integrase
MRSLKQVPLFPSSIDLAAAGRVKKQILAAARAPSTVENYRSAWRNWERWCAAVGAAALPANAALLIDYAAWCIAEGFRFETVLVRLKGVNFEHRGQNLPLPYDETVRRFLANARRHLCERPQGKDAVTPEQLRRIAAAFHVRARLIDIRDCALILIGFACGWRRSELVSLDLEDLDRFEHGVSLWLGKSKTDQIGSGRLVGIFRGQDAATCPVRSLEEWLARRGRSAGPLFTRLGGGYLQTERLDGSGVWRAVKRGMQLIGEDPGRYGAHSLRAGMITASIESGATETSIMLRTGHRSYDTLRRYVRPARAFQSDPLAGVL